LPVAAPADVELLNELERERTLRAKAEERAEKVDSEIEELSVQLFSQANEMVATERRARAKLEERIELLEMKDKDKMARLDRLEKAVTRIDRVKAMLNQPSMNGTTVDSAMLSPLAKR
jgi:predicted RNase H-like nuclease (RuvC/YqgF family)